MKIASSIAEEINSDSQRLCGSAEAMLRRSASRMRSRYVTIALTAIMRRRLEDIFTVLGSPP